MKSNSEELDSLSPDTRLAGRTAIVTGSTSGIGEAIARMLAASGAEVVVSGRDADSAEVLDAMTVGTVAGRPVRPVDTACAVRYLVSDDAAFVHGSVLDVDGGILNARLG